MNIKHNRYWVQVDNDLVGASVVKLGYRPKGGTWKEVTGCLDLCCGPVGGGADLPPSPFNFTTTAGAAGVINLSWNLVTGADSYKLERSTGQDFVADLTVLQNNTALAFSDSGRTSGVIYFYRLSTIMGGEASAFAYASRVAP